MSEADLTQVSAEQDGRVLTGVGVKSEDLERVMERHAVEEPAPTNGNGADPATEEPKKVRGRERYSQLTAERDEAKAKAEAAEKERDELRAKLAQPVVEPQPGRAAIVTTPTPEAQAAPLPETRKKPTEDEVGTKYQSYADFAEDLADWKIEQRLQALDLDGRVKSGIEADRAHQALDRRVGEMRHRATKLYPDFNDILEKGPGANVDLSADEKTARARMNAILNLPEPEHILYALGKDAEETSRLAKLSDVEFGLALARFAPADTTVASLASTGARHVVPPAPFQPVGSGSKTTVLPSSALPQKAGYDFDKSGYRERRAAERGLRRR